MKTKHAMYLDAAGHPDDQEFLVVAGFLASETQWLAFEEEWNRCLSRNDIVPPFHAKDFFYKNKNNSRLDSILKDLVSVIAAHTRIAFSATTDLLQYKLKNKRFRLEEIVGTPYAMTTRNLIYNLNDWKEANRFTDSVLIFVESGTLHEGDMRECLSSRDGLPEPISVPKSMPACQAADLYAYAIFQYSRKGISSNLLDQFHNLVEHHDAAMLKPQFRKFLGEPRVIIHTPNSPEGIKTFIPERSLTEGLNLNFKRTPKKRRMRRVK